MFTIYTAPNCPWCDKAISLLQTVGLRYEVEDAKQAISREGSYINLLKKQDRLNKNEQGRITVPIIVHETLTDIKYIGGYNELAAMSLTELSIEDFDCTE